MSLMKQKINQIIEQEMHDKGIPREGAIKELRYRGKTLAKIMDEFNYKEYTRDKKQTSEG